MLANGNENSPVISNNLSKKLINHLKMVMKLSMPHLKFCCPWRVKVHCSDAGCSNVATLAAAAAGDFAVRL